MNKRIKNQLINYLQEQKNQILYYIHKQREIFNMMSVADSSYEQKEILYKDMMKNLGSQVGFLSASQTELKKVTEEND